MSPKEIALMVQSGPAGLYWYVGSEMNRRGISATVWADVYHHYYTNIKDADPTARFTGPSILNWDFTCIGCGDVNNRFSCEGIPLRGYYCGKVWLKEFIDAYETKYEQKVPVDVWTIDTYPIDWTNTPNAHPDKPALYAVKGATSTHSNIVIGQLEGMRSYLDGSEYQDTPIWITEIAIHVGYDGYKIRQISPLKLAPEGDYNWDLMSDYLDSLLDWLEANSTAKRIDRWYFFVTWQDIVDVAADGYMGIIFFDGPDRGAPMNCLGEQYRARSLGLPPVRCDHEGNTVDG